MPRKHHASFEAIVSGALETPGELPDDVRLAVFERARELGGCRPRTNARTVPLDLAGLVDKIALRAWTTVDADLDVLLSAGYSEDAVFELLVAASVGAGEARLQRGLAALIESDER